MRKNVYIGIIYIISCFPVYSFNQVNYNYPEEEKLITIQYPFLEEIFQEYYFYYCVFAEDVENVISFLEKCLTSCSGYINEKEQIENITLPELVKNKELLKIKKVENYAYLLFSDKVIGMFNMDYIFYDPCNIHLFVGEEYWEYFNFYISFLQGKFFDHDGDAVIDTENLRVEFSNLRKEIMEQSLLTSKYHSFTYQQKTVPIYLPVEFKRDEGLFLFCNHDRVDQNISIYSKWEKVLEDFCNKNSLSRIIFLLPEYE